MSVEGHYRLLSHDEAGNAMYGKLDGATGDVAWVRNWREATTFLTSEGANVARDSARMSEPERRIGVAQRFRDWQEWKKTPKAKKPEKPRKTKGKTPDTSSTAEDAEPPAEPGQSGASA